MSRASKEKLKNFQRKGKEKVVPHLDDDDLGDYNTNDYKNELDYIAPDKDAVEDGPISCAECGDTIEADEEAIHVCPSCAHYLCDGCVEAHTASCGEDDGVGTD